LEVVPPSLIPSSISLFVPLFELRKAANSERSVVAVAISAIADIFLEYMLRQLTIAKKPRRFSRSDCYETAFALFAL
jgi:hypothetical protein